jgi:Holliday junction resolvasome RuvABC endonuclease subunit
MNDAPYILALDISSTHVGLVLYHGKVLDHAEWTLVGDIAERCRLAYSRFYTALERYPQIDVLAIESPIMRFAGTIQQCRVSGAILALAGQRNLPFVEVSPTAAKFALAGKGNAIKQDMQRVCQCLRRDRRARQRRAGRGAGKSEADRGGGVKLTVDRNTQFACRPAPFGSIRKVPAIEARRWRNTRARINSALRRDWTHEEVDRLVTMLDAGHDYDYCARQLRRTRTAIVVKTKRIRCKMLRRPTVLTAREVAALDWQEVRKIGDVVDRYRMAEGTRRSDGRAQDLACVLG